MKRNVKQAALFATTVLVITGILCWPPALKYLVQSSLQQARKDGNLISWSGLSTGIRSAALDSFSILIPGPRIKGPVKLPISVELQNLAVALKVSSLLSLHPTAHYSTAMYGGSLAGEIQPFGRARVISARFENIELGMHPQLAAIGVRGGTVTGDLKDLEIISEGPQRGTFSFNVRGAALPTVDVVKSLLRIDDVGTLDLEAGGEISPDAVEVSTIRVGSMFGNIFGELRASHHLSNTPSISAHFDVSLSEKGTTAFGSWLPFIPGARLDSSTTTFSVNAASVSCSTVGENTAALELGTGCVKLVFSKK